MCRGRSHISPRSTLTSRHRAIRHAPPTLFSHSGRQQPTHHRRLLPPGCILSVRDRKERQLWLLRDRVGEKPLYYGFVGNSFVFASEIGCIADLPDFSCPVNKDVLDIYMIHGYIPAPYTIYEGIFKLEPGKLLRAKAPYREFTLETWWSMADAATRGQADPFTGSLKEASEELERLLGKAVREQMVADVELGAFLSAGIDSSTVVSLMQARSERKVKTFTIGMEEEGYDEAKAAEQIARHLGTEHTTLYITQKDAKEVLPKLAGMFGEPFADSSQIPTYLVSSLTRRHVTVSLSGDGGDELVCGYGAYASIGQAWERIRKLPLPLRNRCPARKKTGSGGCCWERPRRKNCTGGPTCRNPFWGS